MSPQCNSTKITCHIDNINNILNNLNKELLYIWYYEASHGSESQVCDCKCDCLWVRSIFEEMKYLFNICNVKYISSLCCRAKARRWVPLLNTQYLRSLTENREGSVSTLGSLCLPCCVRDTAWSWFYINNINIVAIHVSSCTSRCMQSRILVSISEDKTYLWLTAIWSALNLRWIDRGLNYGNIHIYHEWPEPLSYIKHFFSDSRCIPHVAR